MEDPDAGPAAKKTAAKTEATDAAGGTPQPRGRPPAGKMWDTQQACWVVDPDAEPATNKPATKEPAIKKAVAKEPAITEAAKKPVAKAKPTAAAGGIPRPRGRPPLGKTWDITEGCWVVDPNAGPAVKKKRNAAPVVPEGSHKRPRGAAPMGENGERKMWDAEAGGWTEAVIAEAELVEEEAEAGR